jgi:hypothetical protein
MDASVVRMHLHHMPYFILKKFHFSTLNFQESPLLILNISFGTKWTLNFADPFKRQGLLIFFADGNQVEKKYLVLSLEKMDFFCYGWLSTIDFGERFGFFAPRFSSWFGSVPCFPKKISRTRRLNEFANRRICFVPNKKFGTKCELMCKLKDEKWTFFFYIPPAFCDLDELNWKCQ